MANGSPHGSGVALQGWNAEPYADELVVHIYVSRYRFGPLMIVIGIGSLVIAAIGLFSGLPEDLQPIPVAAGITVPLTIMALYTPLIVAGKPGLRIDEHGVLFGGRPPLYDRTTVSAPWESISEIYLFCVRHWVFTATYIGLRGTQDGQLPISQSMPRGIAETIWHVPTEVVMASRPAYGWKVDKASVKAAAGYFASRVTVVDLTQVAAMQRQLERKTPTIH